MEQEITMELILSVFKNYSEKKTIRQIKDAIGIMINPDGDLFTDDAHRKDVERWVTELINKDKKLQEKSELVYRNGKYGKRKKVAAPRPGDDLPTAYKGTAGECAVMSELMFRGYNANRMMIDEGVDVIAVKDNVYYYIQVKTTSVKDNGNIVAEIKVDRFNQYTGVNQMYYAIVARCKDGNTHRNKNLFFVLPHIIVQQGIASRAIKQTEQGVSIKIKFDTRGEAYLYDEREMSIEFYRDKFDL